MKGSVAGGMWPFAVVLAVSGLINAACFIPVAVEAFRGDKIQSCREKDTRTVWMFAPTALLVVIAVVTGLVPGIVWPGAEAVTDWFFR
jgi:NADH:ubiquinone oxidoreductase subunit 2 (subunit N)